MVGKLTVHNWDEFGFNIQKYWYESNWRASLVPAAAVIPAPVAYVNVVAVKKLVVGGLRGVSGWWWGFYPPTSITRSPRCWGAGRVAVFFSIRPGQYPVRP